MSTVGENVGTDEITTANFGEILLLAHAGFMRQYAEDQSMSAQLMSYATTLEEQALKALQDVPLPTDGLPSSDDLFDLAHPVTDALGLRRLAGLVRDRHRTMSIFEDLGDYQSLIGRTATVSLIEDRPAPVLSDGWRNRRTATGKVHHLFLGATVNNNSYIQLETKGGVFGRLWVAAPLVDPQDLKANYSIHFHPQESEA